MKTFEALSKHFGAVPPNVVNSIGAIEAFRGREEAFRNQRPQLLETLTEIARIQSTEASNAIEGIHAPKKRIEELLSDKTTPANRSEEEIAGYRYVLDLVHNSAAHMPFSVNLVKQLHQNMYSYTGERNVGRFKLTDNTVEERLHDGTRRVRVQTVGAAETEHYMRDLHEHFSLELDRQEHHPLLLIPAYLFDFTVIHPFQDGNGRMSRLLTLLLLYRSGFEVGRFISLERVIEQSKETYYESLQRSTVGWHEGEHNIYPWVSYFLGVMIAAYKEFESRVGVLSGPGSKRLSVMQFIRTTIYDEFSFDDVRQACPGVSDATIKQVLTELKKRGVVEPLSTGRSARWRRLVGDF